MNPRDRDFAAPPPEPEELPSDWATEESIVEPVEGAAPSGGAAAAPAQAPSAAGAPAPGAAPGSSARPVGPTLGASTESADVDWPAADRAPQAPSGAWLASAQGLLTSDRSAPAARTAPPNRESSDDLDFEGTRVYPRPARTAEDWDWEAADAPAEEQPLPVVQARSANRGWVPFDPEPDRVPSPAPAPQQAGAVPAYVARTQNPAASGYGTPPAQWVAQHEDPRGRPAMSQPIADPRPVPAAAYDPAYAYDQFETRPRRGFPFRRLFVSFVLGILLAGFVAGGAIYAYEQQYAEKILPNVYVGSVDLSGLTRDIAHDRLAAAYKSIGDGHVDVTLAGTTTEIPYAAFNRHVDIDAILDQAFGVGRGAAPVERLLTELRAATKGVNLAPTVVLDAAKLEARVHDIAQSAELKAVDAGAVVTADGFATTPSKTGQSVDEGTAAADVAAQLKALDAPQTVAIALTATPIPPAVSDASAQVAATQAALMQNDVVLQDGTDTWTIPAAAVHTWLGFTVINNRVRITIDTPAVLAELTPLAKKIDRPAVNATVKLQGTKIVFGTPSTDGRTFNASKTTTAVVNALRNRALGSLAVDAPIPPVLALVKATLTTDGAKAAIPLMKQISTWQTNYQPSDHNGFGANIRIPTRTINGYVVAPGDTFSFWKAVGPVTKELGYQDGGAIIDGHTEPQGAIGGGICSCSTTLFNAALRAGFAMGDRLNHYYYIDRYPLGLDATVFISASGQAQDMTWTNDTDYPVVIQGINGTAFVKFVLYSVPNGRVTTFTDPIVKNYTKAHTETKVDKTIPVGTTKHLEYATDGQDVTVTRLVKDKSGAVLHKDTYYSHYATITGIILTNP